MSKANGTLASKKDTSALVRAIFEPGMLLQHEDLDQLNAYTRDLSRLLFRSFFGCGVVCGLVVDTDTDSCGKVYVTVGSGLALGCNGDPIYVPKDQRLPIDEHCEQDIDGPLWVVLCGSVKCCGPRTSMCSPDDEEPKQVCTRERDCFEIKIVKEEPKCVCRCPEPDAGGGQVPVESPSSKAQALFLTSSSDRSTDCACADPDDPCYKDHYDGKCGCKCSDDCTCCDCDCVLLAELTKDDGNWKSDHRVRRFVRPVLMRDPQAYEEQQERTDETEKALKTVADRSAVERSLQQSTERVRALEVQLRKASDRNQQLIEHLKRIRQQELETQEKAEYEKTQKQAAKGAKKKDKEKQKEDE
jgi:hypothetical protein